MAEVAPQPPEVQTPSPATTAAPTEAPTTPVADIIKQSGKEPARETLTKIAKLKQFGTYGIMGLMALGMLSQMLAPMMQESEGRSAH